MRRTRKAVPALLRDGREGMELLAFRHPLAGLQIVKGTVEPGECIEAAAVRELREESGLTCEAGRVLGVWQNEITNQEWHFVLMHAQTPLQESWTHHAPDDGGHRFNFFWHPLGSSLRQEWHPVFKEAIGWLKNTLAADDSNKRGRDVA